MGPAFVRSFFDTSVLLPCFFDTHIHHEASLQVFADTETGQGCCAAHSLAEFYANATGYPGKNRMSGSQALIVIDEIRERLELVTLTSEEYHSVIRDASAMAIAGGSIYDALLCRCAEKAGSDLIYTWNLRHFNRFSEGITKKVRTP